MKTNLTIRNCPKEFRFVCPQTWDSLERTARGNVRFCAACKRNVFFCTTDEETIANAIAGNCIARERPDDSELPLVYVGMPAEPIVDTPQQVEAAAWDWRERGIDDSIENAESVRACPNCYYPAPPWRITCRVCRFEMGRLRPST